MPSNSSAHLSDDQLARFEDGELPEPESRHLKNCTECGTRLDDLRAAAAAYLEYRDSIRGPLRPPAPKQWPRLEILIERHEKANSTTPFRWRLALALATAGSLVLALAVMFLHKPGDQPSTRAAELLTQAARVELPQGRQISVRVHGRVLIRPAVLTSVISERQRDIDDVGMAFTAAHYSWREPLSARSFQAWRSQLKKKRDSVSIIRQKDQGESYRVRTDTSSGVLRSAALTLRAQDFRPTDGSFEFESLGTVEVAEAFASAERPAPRSSSAVKEAPTEKPAGAEDTLHVLAALDRIGADVGEPIDVFEDLQHHNVVVSANGISAERQEQIAMVLKPLPRVVLHVGSDTSSTPPEQPTAPEKYSVNIPAPLRQQFEDRLGGAVAFQEATDRILEASASVVAQAHAMEVLARDFAPETEAHLRAQDRDLLRELRENHVRELERLMAQIQTELKPLLAPRDTTAGQGSADTAETWQAGVPNLVVAAQEMDQALNRLLAGSYSQSSGEQMLRGLTSEAVRLESSIKSQEPVGR